MQNVKIRLNTMNCRLPHRCPRVLWFIKISRNHGVNRDCSRYFEVKRDKHGLLQRRLDNLERKFALDGNSVVISSQISSKVPLEPSLLRKALVLVNKRFPLLRMAIHRDSDNAFWFKEMADPSRIAFRLRTNYTASQWVKVFESESLVDVDLEKGPLWRITLLKEEYDNAQQLYTNSFIITISHAIYDGASRIIINEHLLEYLNKLYKGKDVQSESKPLLPPVTYLLRSKLHVSTITKIIFKVMPILASMKSMFVKPAKNFYLQVYPPPFLQNPSIVKRTSLVARVISSEDLLEIVRIAKEHGCTVHSVITAATRLAMAKILKLGSTKNTSNNVHCASALPDSLKFSNSFNVALRKHCQPEVGPDEVGCYISTTTMNIETPCYLNITRKAFWECTQVCNDAVSEKISNDEHAQYELLKFICSIAPYSETHRTMNDMPLNAGRSDDLFNISNLGRFTIGSNEEDSGPFQTKGGYGASVQQRIGNLFSHNIVTVNGVLYWGMSYCPHITTKQQAEDFIDASISILKEGCQL